MNCSEVIRERRSIRKYVTDVVIPRRDIEKMLEAAMMAPSACNTRPWEFVVVENDAVKQQIMGAMPYTQMLKTASLAIVVCGRPDLQEGRCNDFWPQDCGAAIENLRNAENPGCYQPSTCSSGSRETRRGAGSKRLL